MFMSYKDFENKGIKYTNNYFNNLINALRHLSNDINVKELYKECTQPVQINMKELSDDVIDEMCNDKRFCVEYEHVHCTCGKAIKEVYETIHKKTGIKIILGNKCNQHFLDIHNKKESEKKEIKRKILKKDNVYCMICSQKPKILKDKKYHNKCKSDLDRTKGNPEEYYSKLSKCKLRFCKETYDDTFEDIYSKYTRYVDWLIDQRHRKYEPFNLFRDYCDYKRDH